MKVICNNPGELHVAAATWSCTYLFNTFITFRSNDVPIVICNKPSGPLGYRTGSPWPRCITEDYRDHCRCSSNLSFKCMAEVTSPQMTSFLCAECLACSQTRHLHSCIVSWICKQRRPEMSKSCWPPGPSIHWTFCYATIGCHERPSSLSPFLPSLPSLSSLSACTSFKPAPRLDSIEPCFTPQTTQYRLYGRRFLQVKRPNQQYQSTEGTETWSQRSP